ncbi:MAG: type II toxin-antitoxin system RelE/ParE family toxin [Pseudobdellovibrionaceae bacterium]|nr:type II toxin-antitoxin system RelE/ParE family toxin [Pseudobdellovibrionaceae bacterium]
MKDWKALGLVDAELRQLQNQITPRPNGAVELGAGLYKIRLGIAGRGKRGGVRVIYAGHRDLGAIYLLICYAKNDLDNITPEQQRTLATLTSTLRQELMKTRTKR